MDENTLTKDPQEKHTVRETSSGTKSFFETESSWSAVEEKVQADFSLDKKWKLYYDPRCVVCQSFAKLLKRKITNDAINWIPLRDEKQWPTERYAKKFHRLDEFKLISPHGFEFSGKEAVDRLAERFPEVKSYFWMLPNGARVRAIHKTYAFGKWLRKLFKRDCDC